MSITPLGDCAATVESATEYDVDDTLHGARLAQFPWPSVPGAVQRPVWLGRGFQLDAKRVAVLSYLPGQSGWSDALTAFHEKTAGENHPMDRASRALAIRQLRRFGRTDGVVLEIGCSSGFFLRELQQHLPDAVLIGSDYVRGPLETLALAQPELPLLQFDLVNCPLPDACVDAVVMLNVLEHIEDDAAALRQVHRILRPGGLAYVEVPAGPHLYDVFDELLMHHRRYELHGLRRLIEASGLEIVHDSYFGVFIYPPFYVIKQRNKRFMSRAAAEKEEVVSKHIQSTAASTVLSWLLRAEILLGRRLTWPFGTRCVATSRKPRDV